MRLFDRGRAGAVPTVFGQAVIDRGAALLRDAGALRAELQAMAGLEVGQLNIAAGPYAAEDLVGPAVARLVNLRPGLRVRVTVVAPDEIAARGALRSGTRSASAASTSQFAHEDLSIVPLNERRLYLACRPGHPLAGSKPTLKQVLSYPLVTVFMHGRNGASRRDGRRRAPAPKTCRARVLPRPSKSTRWTRPSRSRGAATPCFPAVRRCWPTEFSRGELVRLDFDGPELRTRSALVRMRNRTPSPAALKFMELVRKVEAELLASEEAKTFVSV